MRILLVEDNACTQMLMHDTLQILGHEQRTVNNGVEALAELRRRPYDVVLMDVEMPLLNGTATAHSIRTEFPADRQPRIYLTSARDDEELRRLCMQSDIDGYLTKPVSVSDLEGVLEGSASFENAAEKNFEIPACLNAQHISDLISIQEPGENLLEELGTVFEERGQAILDELEGFLSSGQTGQGKAIVHELKGCALAVGASRVAEVCIQIERQQLLNPVSLKSLQARFREALEAVHLTVSFMD